MRVVLAVLGVLIGAALSSSSVVVGAVLGGFLGFSIAEISLLRAMIAKLDRDVASLRRRLSEAESAPDTEPEPQPPPQSRTAAPDTVPAEALAPASPIVRTSPLEPVAIDAVAAAPGAAGDAPLGRPQGPRDGGPSMSGASLPDNALITAIKRFVTGGNTLVQAGVVVLFFGVAFLLRYLAEHSHVSIEVRLSAIALGAVVLLAVGWRLRRRKTGYALALQGGGVGILYLTVFAALRLYGLLPPALGFGVLVLIAVFSAALAVLQDSAAFAVLGVVGGFLAPVLASTGEGSHVVLFTYYAVLNIGLSMVAWFKAWRPLNITGFLFTFAIATAWGVLKYQPQAFPSTEPFLILFFLLYVAIAVLFTLRQPLNLRGLVDGPLVFGNPIAAFGLQSAMLRHDSMALAYSAIFMSALYLSLTFVLKRLRNASQTLLFESFLALGVAFLTLAIPLALGSRLNSAAWALEGAALVWIGCRQNRRAARAVGTLLIVCSAALLIGEPHDVQGSWVIPSSLFPGVILVSAACLSSVWNLDRVALSSYEQPYAPVLFVVGLMAWVLGGITELPNLVAAEYLTASKLGFLAGSALISSELARRASLERAAPTALLLLPVMCAFFLDALGRGAHPFAAGGWLAWPAAFTILYLVMYRHEGDVRPTSIGPLHALSAWLLCLILGWEVGWAVDRAIRLASPEWGQAARMLPPAVVLLLLSWLTTRVAWPFVAHRGIYLRVVGVGLSLGLVAWSLSRNFLFEGNAAPLPYVPLLNPLDVAQATTLLVVLRSWLIARHEPALGSGRMRPWMPPAIIAFAGFVWLNGVLLRSLHHWIGVPLGLGPLAASNVVQTSVSIFWSILALATMLSASRRRYRPAWLVGAALLTVVIIKLFFIDLASVGSIERIVSFVGVGIAMLVVGYFSPLPPRLEES